MLKSRMVTERDSRNVRVVSYMQDFGSTGEKFE